MRRTDFVSSVQDRLRKALVRQGEPKAAVVAKYLVMALYERHGLFYWEILSLEGVAKPKEEIKYLWTLKLRGWIEIASRNSGSPGAWKLSAGPRLLRIEKAAHDALGVQTHPGRSLGVVGGGDA